MPEIVPPIVNNPPHFAPEKGASRDASHNTDGVKNTGEVRKKGQFGDGAQNMKRFEARKGIIQKTETSKNEDQQETKSKTLTNSNTQNKPQDEPVLDQKEDNKDQSIPVNTKETEEKTEILVNPVANPIWLSISEAAKIGGVNTKTIRRAIQAESIKYTIYKNKYLVGMRSLIVYMNSSKKLRNKLNFHGLGQYINKWRD